MNVIKDKRLLLIAWAGWGCLILGFYYRRFGLLLQTGLIQWIRDTPSLVYTLELGRLFKTGLPHLGDAFHRASTSNAGFAIVILSAQVIGWVVLRWIAWQPTNWRERFLFQTALGLGGLGYLYLLMASLGLYKPNIVRANAFVLLCAGSVVFFAKSGFLLRKAGTTSIVVRQEKIRINKDGWLWIGLIFLSVIVAWLGALAPEVEYDALWYHLWLPKIWLAQGSPVDRIAEYVSLYPLTVELVYGAGIVLGGAISAKLIHWLFLILAIFVLYEFSKQFLPLIPPWLASAVFVTVPTVLWEATTAYIDLALTVYVSLSVYALIHYWRKQDLSWLLLSGVCMGLAISVKVLALAIFAIIGIGWAISCLWKGTAIRKAVSTLAILVVLGLAIPAPWFFRSWWCSGNPVFPEMYRVFGARPPERWDALTEKGLDHFKARFGFPRTIINQTLLPWNVTMHAAHFGGSLGPVFLLLLPVAIFGPRRNQLMAIFLAGIFTFGIFWSSPLSSFQMRFLLVILPFSSLLVAESIYWLSLQLPVRTRKWHHFLIAGLLFLNLPPFISIHESEREGYLGWFTHVIHQIPLTVVLGAESQTDYLVRKVPSYSAWDYINTHLPLDSYILTFSGGDHFYSERERLWSDSTLARPAVWQAQRGQEAMAVAALRRLRVTHILLDKHLIQTLPADALAIAQPGLLSDCFSREYYDDRFELYRVEFDSAKCPYSK